MKTFVGIDVDGVEHYLALSEILPGLANRFPAIAGDVWHVRPTNGDDTNHNGGSPDQAFKTLAKALASATANQNDVVILHADGTSVAACSDLQSATLDWNKNLVHLVGANNGPLVSHRSRVGFISTYVTASNLFTLSAQGCLIKNIEFITDVADAHPTGCMLVTGSRNVIENCHIAGIAANELDIAGAYSLYLNAAHENVFRDCAIGLDSMGAGTAANSEILFDGSCARNFFDRCFIHRQIEHATNHPLVKLVDATSVDRWLWFRQCVFHSASTNYAVGQVGVFKLSAAMTTGEIILQDCAATSGDRFVTTTKWCADDRNNITVFGPVIPPADTQGLGKMV